MIRDRLASLARGTVSVLLGLGLIYAIGRWLRWWVPVVIMLAAAGAFVWEMTRLPARWRPW